MQAKKTRFVKNFEKNPCFFNKNNINIAKNPRIF